MALDVGAIAAAKEDLDKRGSGDLIKVGDLADKGEMDIRILPPTASLGKFYYLKTVDLKLGKDGGWVKSLATFGDPDCPVMKIWNEAKQSEDAGVKQRAKEIIEKPSYFLPVIQITGVDAKGNVKEVKMGCCSAKATIISAISGFFADGKYANGTDDLLADRIDWPEAVGEERERRRPLLAAIRATCDAFIAQMPADLIEQHAAAHAEGQS